MTEPLIAQDVEDVSRLAAKGESGFTNLTPSQRAYYRVRLEKDPFLFLTAICGFKNLVPRFHAPLAYLLGGCSRLLAWSLQQEEYRSVVTDQIRDEMRRPPFRIDWNDTSARNLRRIDKFCDYIDVRMFRGAYKSSVGVGTNAWDITQNPNVTMLLMHAVDPSAWDMANQIGEIILSDYYKLVWPDRVPEQPKLNITQGSIWLRGRTVPHKEHCVTALGAQSTITGKHFDKFYFDDLVTEEMSDVEVLAATSVLGKIDNLSIRVPGTRVRRIHVGTRYHAADDYSVNAKDEHCVKVYVPLEVFDEPVTVENYRREGRITLPEVVSREMVNDMKRKAPNLDGGVRSYLMNMQLVTKEDGDKEFPEHLLRRTFRLVDIACKKCRECDAKQRCPYAKKYILRQARDREGQLLFEDIEKSRPKLLTVDPATLQYAIGVDPAVSSSGTADQWGASALGMDSDGVVYQMQTDAGKGWKASLRAVSDLDKKYGYPPRIGWEKGVLTDLLSELQQLDERYRIMRSRIVPVDHKNARKEDRIRRFIRERLEVGEFLWNEADEDTRREARLYVPGKNAKDNRLDSIAIAMTQIIGSVSYKTEAESAKEYREYQREQERSLDRETGVQVYAWASDDYSGW